MVKRGDVYYADLDPGIGSEQQGCRPVVIIQNDMGNKYSPTTIVATITSRPKRSLPTHVHLRDGKLGLTDGSIVMLEQIRTIDKRRLRELVGHVNPRTMKQIDNAALRSLSINT